MPLTFEDVSSAWKKAMFEKDSGPISRILAEDFTWNILSRKDGAKANKQFFGI